MRVSKNSLSPTIQMRSSGFTLIELMVTIAVLAIIVGIAAPSISTQLANQRVKATANTLANALKEAKVESVIRRQEVAMTYRSSSTPNAIIVQDADDVVLFTYPVHRKSSVTINPSTAGIVTFRPNKIITSDEDVVYTVCDSGSSNETPKQVRINKVANISIINSGSC